MYATRFSRPLNAFFLPLFYLHPSPSLPPARPSRVYSHLRAISNFFHRLKAQQTRSQALEQSLPTFILVTGRLRQVNATVRTPFHVAVVASSKILKPLFFFLDKHVGVYA